MLPSIPDKASKLLLALFMLFFGYSYYTNQNAINTFYNRQDILFEKRASIKVNPDLMEYKAQRLKEMALNISLKYHIVNPIRQIKDGQVFDEVFSGDKAKVQACKEIKPFWDDYKQAKFIYKKESEENTQRLKEIDNDIKFANNRLDEEVGKSNTVLIFAELFFGFAIVIFILEELASGLKDESLLICQSCAKRLNAVVQNARFNDGEVNKYFCKECFSDDKFTDMDFTAQKAYENIINKTKLNRLDRIMYKIKINNLNRWLKGPY